MLALQPELQTLRVSFNALVQVFLTSFLVPAIVAVPLEMSRCYHFGMKEFLQKTAKLYILCLFLGFVCSFLAWIMSHRIRLHVAPEHQNAISNVSKPAALICAVKFVWCWVPLLWSSQDYHIYVFIFERGCAGLTLHKLKDLATLYNAFHELPM